MLHTFLISANVDRLKKEKGSTSLHYPTSGNPKGRGRAQLRWAQVPLKSQGQVASAVLIGWLDLPNSFTIHIRHREGGPLWVPDLLNIFNLT